MRGRKKEVTWEFLMARSPSSLRLVGGNLMVTVRPARLPRSAIRRMSSPPHRAPLGTYTPWWIAAALKHPWRRGEGGEEVERRGGG